MQLRTCLKNFCKVLEVSVVCMVLLQVLELTLQVWAPLSVHVLPPRQTVDVGKSADLHCQAAGFPRKQVLWLKDGRPLRGLADEDPAGGPGGGSRVRLLAPDHLHIASVAKEDRGMYQCVVRNDLDMAQGAAELRLGGRQTSRTRKGEI